MEKGTNEERDYEPVTRATRVPSSLSSNDYLLCICDGHCEDCSMQSKRHVTRVSD